ncbi:MAG: CD1247 N-terminal domain-containing protein [Aristaeellaceae bacterium]
MSKLTDKVSYLKGLAAGMKLNMEKDSNKLILEILNAMGEMAEEMQAMTDAHDELNEYVESIDDDLADLEETLFGDEDEDAVYDEDDDADADEDDELISYACPSCGHELQFRASDVDFDEDYLCPVCGKPVFPELEEDDDAPAAEDSDESDE